MQTVSLAVAPWDADMIVVTGWSSVDHNSADEPVLLTRDAGDTWEVMICAHTEIQSPPSTHHVAGRDGQSSNRRVLQRCRCACAAFQVLSAVPFHAIANTSALLLTPHLHTGSPVLIDSIWQSGPSLIVLGTATGVFASVCDHGSTGRWFRVGLCNELPMVMLQGIV